MFICGVIHWGGFHTFYFLTRIRTVLRVFTVLPVCSVDSYTSDSIIHQSDLQIYEDLNLPTWRLSSISAVKKQIANKLAHTHTHIHTAQNEKAI